MAKPKELRRLKIYDIQRILYWVFNLSKRPSFLPLRAKDRPSAVNIVKLEASPVDAQKVLGKFNIKHTARINESIPFNMLLDCLLRDGNYDAVPSLDYITMENLTFIPVVDFEKVYRSEVFVNSEMSLVKEDFSGYKRADKVSKYDIVALDVEKVETAMGKELGRVTIVDDKGEVIYDKIIKPRSPVLDYLTRYSGLTKEIVDKGIDTQLVKSEVLSLVGTNTVIVGHGIENDLSSLELYHNKIIDTAHLFLSPEGRKVSLAQLSKTYLGKTIHVNTHDSKVDAITCLELLSVKIQHILSITDVKRPEIKIEAKIVNRHIMDLLECEKKHLNLAICNYEELKKCARTYKRTRECLWMFLYEVNNKVYFSF